MNWGFDVLLMASSVYVIIAECPSETSEILRSEASEKEPIVPGR